jgi:hypothetical protein
MVITGFSETLQPLLNQIKSKEKTLKQLATMATMESVKGRHTVDSMELQEEDLILFPDRHSPKD